MLVWVVLTWQVECRWGSESQRWEAAVVHEASRFSWRRAGWRPSYRRRGVSLRPFRQLEDANEKLRSSFVRRVKTVGGRSSVRRASSRSRVVHSKPLSSWSFNLGRQATKGSSSNEGASSVRVRHARNVAPAKRRFHASLGGPVGQTCRWRSARRVAFSPPLGRWTPRPATFKEAKAPCGVSSRTTSWLPATGSSPNRATRAPFCATAFPIHRLHPPCVIRCASFDLLNTQKGHLINDFLPSH